MTPQRGGGTKEIYLRQLIEVLKLRLIMLRNLLPSLFANIKEEVTGKQSMESKYTDAARDFIAYNLGEINKYDEQLFKLLKQFKLDIEPALMIFFTMKKRDLVPIVNRYMPLHTYAIMNIIRLKKLSAYEKFKKNYGVNGNDIRILQGKQFLF